MVKLLDSDARVKNFTVCKSKSVLKEQYFLFCGWLTTFLLFNVLQNRKHLFKLEQCQWSFFMPKQCHSFKQLMGSSYIQVAKFLGK